MPNYNPAASNSVGSATAPTLIGESPSQIRDAVSATEQAVGDLHEAINFLEKRLDTVLLPVPPSNTPGVPGTPQAIGSHMHGRVVQVNQSFSHAIDRLRDLARRVDV